MAEYVDPNPVDKYNYTEEGGISIDQSFDDVGTATHAFAKITPSDEAYLWLYYAGAQGLETRIAFGGSDGEMLSRNGTGDYYRSDIAGVQELLEDGTYKGSAVLEAGGNLHQVEIQLNGDGDVRLFSRDVTTGSLADVIGEDLLAPADISPVSATNDAIL